MLRAFDRQIPLIPLMARLLAFALMATGVLLISVAVSWISYLATLHYPDDSWPSGLDFVRGDTLYFAISLIPFGLGFWLYRRDKMRRSTQMLAFALMATGVLLISFTALWTAYFARSDWPEDLWPGWPYYIRWDALYCAIWLIPFGLGFWLYHQDKVKHQAQNGRAYRG